MTKLIRLCTESELITVTRRLYLFLQTKGKHTAVRLQAISKDEILYAYDKTKKNESSFKSQTSSNTKDIFVCSRQKIDNTTKWLQRQQPIPELYLHMFARNRHGGKTQDKRNSIWISKSRAMSRPSTHCPPKNCAVTWKRWEHYNTNLF